MGRRLAVVGSHQIWRRGISSLLIDAGYTTVEYEALESWTPGLGGSAVVYRMAETAAEEHIATFVETNPYIPIVAVAAALDASTYASAVRSGATGVVSEEASAETFRMSIEASIAGHAVVPADVIGAMARLVPLDEQYRDTLSQGHVDQLRQLATGMTVAAMADHAGYSEREMFRILHDLYKTIGVGNRTEAIIWATRRGVLDATETDHA